MDTLYGSEVQPVCQRNQAEKTPYAWSRAGGVRRNRAPDQAPVLQEVTSNENRAVGDCALTGAAL